MKLFAKLPPWGRHLCLIILPILVLYLPGFFWAGPHAPETRLESMDRTAIFAHGGGQGLAPANSLKAMTASFKAGSDFLEIDIHETRDGHIVLMHDEAVDRTSDGSGLIENMTLGEVKALRLGGSTTLAIPTLAETFKTFPASRFLVEIKKGPETMPARLCSVIRDFDAAPRIIIASFHDDAMQAFRSACPEVATSLSKNEVTRFVLLQKIGLPWMARLEGSAFHVPESNGGIRIITPGFVKAAHARGLDVVAWTINDEADMARLVSMGVDGLITDYPDLGLQVAKDLERHDN